uniref:MIER family member 2 n=1 Tax=Bubo bubo TaxID=30461 RepID=A0A8C0FKP9_BUBBB
MLHFQEELSQPCSSLSLKASVGRQSPRVVPYPARSLCPGDPGLQSAAVVSMGSADHRLNLAEILSQNYGVREEREEEDDTQEKQKSLEELEKSFSASQSSEMPFEELLALYGYEASDPISEQDSESNDITPNLPDMTLDKEQIAKDLLSGEEEEETQSSADDLTPSVTSHDASDLFPNQPGSNNFLADEDKEPCSSPCASSMAEESEEDSIPSNECKKEIMVGPQYQATVPILHLNRHGEKGKAACCAWFGAGAAGLPGLYALPPAGPGLAEKQETLQSSGETITMDFTLPADINEGLPLIAGPVDLDRDPEAVVAPAQLSLSVTDFGLIGIGDVNSFLTAHQACPAPVARSEPLSQ